MQVRIQNWENGQLVQHSSILFLKGVISFESATSTPDDFTLNILQIFHNDSPSPCSFKSFKTSFITLVQLSAGPNTFHFKEKETGKTFHTFQLTYIPPEGDYRVRTLFSFSQDNSQPVDHDWDCLNDKLTLGMGVIQSFFGEKLFEHRFSKRSFTLETERSDVGTLPIDLKSEDLLEMGSGTLWEYLAKVIRGRVDLWSPTCKYVVFMGSPWKFQGEERHNNGKVALGGGGLVLMGSDFLSLWPREVNQVLETIFNGEALQDPGLDESARRFGDVGRTVGSLYAASLGSLAHELGHVFDLGHSDLGLMGSQFHRMDMSLAPLFSYPPVSKGTDFVTPKVGLPGGMVVEDVVSIGRSCATILYFHRWFVPGSLESARDEGPSLQKEKLASEYPLTAVQIRAVDDGRILKDWTFLNEEKTSITTEFVVAKNYIPLTCKSGDALLVAQDLQGNIFKTSIKRDLLPQSFTVIQRR